MFLKLKNSSKILVSLCFTLCSLNSFAAIHSTQLPARVSEIKAGDQHVVLLGNEVAVGQSAPAFKVVDNNFKAVSLADFSGKTILLSVVPSIDTGVCSLQTKRFNEEVAKLPADVVLLTISTDLPFAQKRFCQQEQVEAMAVLSDAVWREFGSNYGLLIQDMGLLARAIIIIDNDGIIRYQQMVPRLAQEPDYDAAIAALKQLTKA